MKIRALKDFYDLELKRNIPEGKTYEVTKERAEHLVKLELVCIAEVKTEDKPKRKKKNAE